MGRGTIVDVGESEALNHFFFFNDTATTEIYTLSLHDALPISGADRVRQPCRDAVPAAGCPGGGTARSEEHTSELQSQFHLVCRLLLEKKKHENQCSPRPQDRPSRRCGPSRGLPASVRR